MRVLQVLKKLRSESYAKEVVQAHLIWKLNQLSYLDLSVPESDFYNMSESIQDAELLIVDLKNLLPCLKKAPSVRCLDLRGNNLGNKGAKILADFLAQESNLESLFIEGNNIQDKGAMALAKGLEKNSCLLSLDPEQTEFIKTFSNSKDSYDKEVARERPVTCEFVKVASNQSPNFWFEGNPISPAYINIVDKILLRKRCNYTNKKLAQESAICKLSQEPMNQEIKKSTQVGALGELGRWLSAIPIFFTGGAIHRMTAAFKSKMIADEQNRQKTEVALKYEEATHLQRPPALALAPCVKTAALIPPIILSYENEDGMIEITLQHKKPVPHF